MDYLDILGAQKYFHYGAKHRVYELARPEIFKTHQIKYPQYLRRNVVYGLSHPTTAIPEFPDFGAFADPGAAQTEIEHYTNNDQDVLDLQNPGDGRWINNEDCDTAQNEAQRVGPRKALTGLAPVNIYVWEPLFLYLGRSEGDDIAAVFPSEPEHFKKDGFEVEYAQSTAEKNYGCAIEKFEWHPYEFPSERFLEKTSITRVHIPQPSDKKEIVAAVFAGMVVGILKSQMQGNIAFDLAVTKFAMEGKNKQQPAISDGNLPSEYDFVNDDYVPKFSYTGDWDDALQMVKALFSESPPPQKKASKQNRLDAGF